MGDDGVGPAALEELRRCGIGDRAELIDAGLAFGEVLCDLSPDRPLIIIDALQGADKPGSVYKLTLADLSDPSGSMPKAMSLHEINVLPILRMEALGGREFTNVTIFGVQPENIAWSEWLSTAVKIGMKKLVQDVCDYLDEIAPVQCCAACGSEN